MEGYRGHIYDKTTWELRPSMSSYKLPSIATFIKRQPEEQWVYFHYCGHAVSIVKFPFIIGEAVRNSNVLSGCLGETVS